MSKKWLFVERKVIYQTNVISNSIDCFELSLLNTPTVCIRNGTEDQFVFNPEWRKFPSYRLIRSNDRKMKLIAITNPETESEANTEPFNGTLEGVPITAAFNWTQSGEHVLYLFAGRHLCRQEISFDWVPMCNITDISDLVIDCTQGNHQTSVGPQTLLVMSSVVISLFRLLF